MTGHSVVSERGEKLFYGWWVVFALCIALIFGVGSAFYTVSVFLEPIKETLGWTTTQVSLGFTLAALAAAVMSPLVGLAIARFGVKRVLAFGAVATGISLAGMSQIRQIWHYYTMTLIMAAGISCLGLIAGTTCVSDWFVKKRGTATGIIFAASGIGGMTMVFVASQAVEAFDWRVTYALLGAILFLVVLPVVLIVVRNKPEDVGLEPDGGLTKLSVEEQPSGGTGFEFKEAIGTVPYWLMAFLMLCYAVAFGSMTQHAIALLRSIGIVKASLFWSLTLGISVLGRLLFGIMADRFSRKGLILVTWLFHFMGLVSALLVPGVHSLVWFFSLFYGLGQGAFGTVFPVLLGELFGIRNFSKLYGTILLFQAIGFGVGAAFFGKIFDSAGSYVPAIWIIAIMSLICLIAGTGIRPPRVVLRGNLEGNA